MSLPAVTTAAEVTAAAAVVTDSAVAAPGIDVQSEPPVALQTAELPEDEVKDEEHPMEVTKTELLSAADGSAAAAAAEASGSPANGDSASFPPVTVEEFSSSAADTPTGNGS